MFSYGEWRLGTDAIRFLRAADDKHYWMDPRLYPSLLYMFGLLKHEEEQATEKFENDDSIDQDIIIEDELEEGFIEEEEDKTEGFEEEELEEESKEN